MDFSTHAFLSLARGPSVQADGLPRRARAARTPIEVVLDQAGGERQNEQCEDDIPAPSSHQVASYGGPETAVG